MLSRAAWADVPRVALRLILLLLVGRWLVVGHYFGILRFHSEPSIKNPPRPCCVECGFGSIF